MMNKLIVCSYSILIIILSLTCVKSLDKKLFNKLWIINHGFVDPKILLITDTRPRRWTNSHNEVHVSINNWIFKTHKNNELIVTSNFITYWIVSDESIIPVPMSQEICQVSHGLVNDDENSRVIMTICDTNFYVFFQFGNRSFTVNPTANGSHILEESILQSLSNKNMNYSQKIKRDLLSNKSKNVHNLTGDTFYLGDDNGPMNVESVTGFDEQDSQNYFSDHTWMNSKLSSKFKTDTEDKELARAPGWLELGIAVDYSVIEFHGDRVQQYILALLNIVSAIYRDPSLEANLTLVIVHMIFYIEKKDGMVREGNARKSLENVNKWNRNILSSSNKTHDVALWLTRLDIGGPSGYAPVSGVCDPTRSCALNRDEGLTSAFIIAHELAHILGLTHDGDETADNFCGREAAMGSVMAPMVAATFHRFHWSLCSKKEYHHRVKQWTCLNNYPNNKNITLLREIFHDSFTMDEQCRMEFGDGYELCRSFDLPGLCFHLWCSHENTPQLCKTKKGPPLEGTPCGKDRWCVNGYCKSTDQTMFEVGLIENNPENDGWSEWSSWNKCSTTCGVGIQLRSRLCNDSISNYNEDNCKGNNNDFRICEQTKCSSLIDLRREQCNRLSNIMITDKTPKKNKMIWIPHVVDNKNDTCRLTCKNINNRRIYISDGFVIDGTPCFYNSSNICIKGKCYSMGCDNVLNSTKHRDACGICGGDNSTCISISSKFQRKILRANTRIAIVPAISYNINIKVEIFSTLLTNNSMKFIFRDGQRKKYEMKFFDFNDNFSIIIVEGTEFRMKREVNQYEFFGRGPTLNKIVISFHVGQNMIKRSTILVNFQYLVNKIKESRKMNLSYSWLLDGWSPCSATCGGGIQRQIIACKNDQIGKIENLTKCLYISKPIQEVKQCNTFSCEFKWIVTEWESCTKTCGIYGIQQRQIYCVYSSFPDNQVTNDNTNAVYRAMLSPNICHSQNPPEVQRNCNRFPCQDNWIPIKWTTCSRSCDHGMQPHMTRCISPNGVRLFECDNKRSSDELRLCKGYRHNLMPRSCGNQCRRDKNRYCIVTNSKLYCQIAEFKRYCCRICLKKKDP